jgi:hypothetical protein
MNQISRQDHFVPSFYLVGFSDSGKRKGQVWQFDSVEGTVSPHLSKAIGKELDYHTVRIAGSDSDGAEKLFSKIEGIAAPILKVIAATRRLPSDRTELGNIMMFVALSYFRGPRDRQFNESSLTKIETMRIRMCLMSPERWAKYVAWCEQEGKWYPQGTFEELSQRFRVEEESVQIGNASELHTANIVGMLVWICDQFKLRYWGIEYIDTPSDFFITSDSPSAVAWTDRSEFDRFGSCGLHRSRSEVLFPLTKQVALVGRDTPVPESSHVSSDRVASINGITAGFAHRFLYGPAEDFLAQDNAGNRTSSASWFKWKKETRR